MKFTQRVETRARNGAGNGFARPFAKLVASVVQDTQGFKAFARLLHLVRRVGKTRSIIIVEVGVLILAKPGVRTARMHVKRDASARKTSVESLQIRLAFPTANVQVMNLLKS